MRKKRPVYRRHHVKNEGQSFARAIARVHATNQRRFCFYLCRACDYRGVLSNVRSTLYDAFSRGATAYENYCELACARRMQSLHSFLSFLALDRTEDVLHHSFPEEVNYAVFYHLPALSHSYVLKKVCISRTSCQTFCSLFQIVFLMIHKTDCIKFAFMLNRSTNSANEQPGKS